MFQARPSACAFFIALDKLALASSDNGFPGLPFIKEEVFSAALLTPAEVDLVNPRFHGTRFLKDFTRPQDLRCIPNT
jgi:hypothetical protein